MDSTMNSVCDETPETPNKDAFPDLTSESENTTENIESNANTILPVDNVVPTLSVQDVSQEVINIPDNGNCRNVGDVTHQNESIGFSDKTMCTTSGAADKTVEEISENQNVGEDVSVNCNQVQIISNIVVEPFNPEVPQVQESNTPMTDEQSHNPSSDIALEPTNIKIKSEAGTDPKQQSSLSLLAQYDTDDDSDDDVLEIPATETYQNRCVEIDSESSTSDIEFLSEDRDQVNLELYDELNEMGDDDEEGNSRFSQQPKVKGELELADLPPIQDLHITVPEEECTELGTIHSVVEQLVLVNALPGTVPLDIETILFRDKGKTVLGEVFDVLGQVSDPLYCVRFNSNKEIIEKGIQVGQTVYVAPRTEHTQFIVLANLMKVRGSDASWENDVEPPPRYIDYSDDEEERSARRPNRKRNYSFNPMNTGTSSYTQVRPTYRGSHSYRGGARLNQPSHQAQGNYNIVGNSWHSNYYRGPAFNQPQYRPPMHSPGGFNRSPFNSTPTHFQQPPPVNTGLVVNPYAVYPPPHVMQQTLFPPPNFQQPPPPPPQ